MDGVLKLLARLVFIKVPPGLFNRRLALEMALHADLVAPRRIELGGINDGPTFRVLRSRSVASFATDAGLGERWVGIAVLRSLNRWLHAADVAMQATGEGRQIHGDQAGVTKSGCHVPDMPARIPVHGTLKQKTIPREQIGSTSPSRANVIDQLAPAPHAGIVRTLETQPDL